MVFLDCSIFEFGFIQLGDFSPAAAGPKSKTGKISFSFRKLLLRVVKPRKKYLKILFNVYFIFLYVFFIFIFNNIFIITYIFGRKTKNCG
ncbi:MAG: hypothetical protein A3A16_03215 [Candidatus Harrisonbacteria bacterium RIFCSPLOWO2_01_FULL_44_18]|uniref:Uncharacterized protein n=1 Tax=Candidatus Harrisonbacteria bacterium RIFCSPLOWO2_01_FULL_44_18 TaxID=1798407 RepID=A0A1G1ZLK7_9BACT|nr:MAG: hypothetical protein A3A16_03215 [Candidatus Harrisonbacteria bacterium RIFCSPLOWO2_01_FULL_44_18]